MASVHPPASAHPPSRDQGLDLLKALSIIAVLLWHLQPIQLVNVQNQVTRNFSYFIDAINQQLFLLAVPLFFVISLHLFLKKANSNSQYLYTRLTTLAKIFTFWTGFHLVFYCVTQLILGEASGVRSLLTQNPIRILIGLYPSLPLVGDSVFYFLFDLMCLVGLAYFYRKVQAGKRKIFSILVIVASTLYFEYLLLTGQSISYYRLDNFFVYVAVADLFTTALSSTTLSSTTVSSIAQTPAKLSNSGIRSYVLGKFKYLSLALFVAFSMQDIILRMMVWETSLYGRASVLYGCLMVLGFIYPMQANLQNNFLLQRLAQNSLGFYALHKYWLYLFLLLANHVDSWAFLLGGVVPIVPLIVSVLVLIATTITIDLLKKTPLQQFL
ncbi:acyltransferase [Alkalinema sp. FACHB-956]|uniref:acyltransferase family protein n=1 Tax=Alkalinema sp. FACHB-956 TaxID=2692768 RepID=UPI001686D559|nr:acyltransferase [Alkalinema sp. FACHB-956]MBD2325767.1 acyltransferase [Alkalinema sp. FACHB-956]